jgi:hypothetical protein
MNYAARRSFNHRTMLEQHLAVAERHIVDGREHVLHQHQIIARLESRGLGNSQTADTARQLLHSFQDSLAQHMADRDRLLSGLA